MVTRRTAIALVAGTFGLAGCGGSDGNGGGPGLDVEAGNGDEQVVSEATTTVEG